MGEKFGKDYFIKSRISNYQDYTKKKYGELCMELIEIFGIKKDDRIVDWGCATGNLIREFVERGYTNIVGSDISNRAIGYGIQNGLGKYLKKYNPKILQKETNKFVIMNDVLEHMVEDDIKDVLGRCRSMIILRVPVCAKEGEDYVLECSRNDKTHIIRWTKKHWLSLFTDLGYIVEEIHGKYIYSSDGVLACVLKKGK